MKKPELLAPAGNMECLYSAINAGADAIYLAGKKFGARAFADNFETEELIYALKLSHLHGKKIYLTLNTLIKEREFDSLYDFIKPLYDNKLDGIIIQDLGLINFLKSNFPDLSIHASTQMTVTGVYAAKLLKENGISRIVPARELTLEEIQHIKSNVDIEIETFVHGAMCYSYSGQCLYSSYLGGRSGNRGRCAGPCRLPYTIAKDDRYIAKDNIKYPLSLKDMCTLPILNRLIDSSIDSFKIEGRLKSPEYVAGVTSIYRKYIDIYCETGKFDIENKDIELLKKLYLRSSICEGYYEKFNGAEMITAQSPSYMGSNDKSIEYIKEKYVMSVKKLPVFGLATLSKGHRTSIILRYENHIINCEGDMVEKAQNRPLTKDDVLKQLNKTGDSFFFFDKLEVEMEDDCFMPVKMLNELRRNAFEQLLEEIINE